MKIFFCYIILFLFVLANVSAQDNLQVQFGYNGTAAAARFLPSSQLDSTYKFELSINYNFWVANKSLTYGSIRQIQNENRLTNEDIQNIINDLDENNRMGLSQDFLIFGLGLTTSIKKHPVVWNFTISDRLNANVLIPKTLVQLVWQGNKQFEGETIDLSQTSLSGLYFREFSLGFATQVKQWDNWTARLGLRLNYYQGLTGLTNPKKQFLFTTATNAEYLELDYDFEYRYTGIDDFDLFDTRGHGFGINLGATISYKNKLQFDLGLTDLGSIKFKQDIYKIGTENDFIYTGLGLNELVDPTAYMDSLEVIFTPSIDSLSNNSFKMSVGTRLSLMISWKYGQTRNSHRPKSLFFVYSQGFSEQPGSTLNPKFALGLNRPIFKHLVLGANVTIGGFNNFAVGALLGVHLKHFRFSVQSDDFTGFIFPNKATGASIGVMMQVVF